jgi:hypothetical protein
VRQRFEREGASGSCRGRWWRRLQGNVAAGEVGGTDGAMQGAKPSAGRGRQRQVGQAVAEAVRGGWETLDLQWRRLWRSNHEAVAAGNLASRSHVLPLAGPQPKWKRQLTPHLPTDKAQSPH